VLISLQVRKMDYSHMTDVNEYIFDTYMVCGWKFYTQVTVLTVKVSCNGHENVLGEKGNVPSRTGRGMFLKLAL